MFNGTFFALLIALTPLAQTQASTLIDEPSLVLKVLPEESTLNLFQEAPCMTRNDCYLLQPGTGSRPPFVAVPNNQNLRLLGKGVQGKDTNQNLSIACVGPENSCDQMRFIYYVNPQELYFLGPKFQVVNRDPKVLKMALKALHRRAQGGSRQTTGAITLFTALGAAFFLLPTVGPLPFVLLFGGAFVSHQMLGGSRAAEPFDLVNYTKELSRGIDGIQLINQNGWNWSSKPRRISEKLFRNMVYQFQFANGFFQSGASQGLEQLP